MKQRVKPKQYHSHTSVSLKQDHIQLLEKMAKEHKISVNDLMVLLLRFISDKAVSLNIGRARVRYQASSGSMKIVNLYIGQRDYERNLDARRYGKVSVSWLLAYAIDHFLFIVIQKIDKSVKKGIEVLNNYVGLQTFRIKKNRKNFKKTCFVSIWRPKRE